LGKGFEKLTVANKAGKYLCVGLDPDPVHARKVVRGQGYGLSDMLVDDEDYSFQYAMELIEYTAPVAAAFKLNYEFWADYDRKTLRAVVDRIRTRYPAITIILDRKYGDIGNTSARSAAFAKKLGVDMVTVNPYMGTEDVTKEFVKVGIDCFVLARTSNEDAGRFQELTVSNLNEDLNLAQYVAGDATLGGHGLVVGATSPSELALLREASPSAPFLIPGVGAQGGDLSAVLVFMREHKAPWIINVGRGIAEVADTHEAWASAVKAAALKYHDTMVPVVRDT
jgi:orotidine-5'-phosphate decarboxylase